MRHDEDELMTKKYTNEMNAYTLKFLSGEYDLAILVILSGSVMSNFTPFGAPEPIISPTIASQIEL